MRNNDVSGAPGTIRTSDPQIRSLMLYPAELRARVSREVAGTTARGRQDFKNGRRRKRPPSYRLRLQMARSGFGDLECILARRSGAMP